MTREVSHLPAAATAKHHLADVDSRVMGDLGRIWTAVLTADRAGLRTESTEGWSPTVLESRDPDAVAVEARRSMDELRERVLGAVLRRPSVIASPVVVPS